MKRRRFVQAAGLSGIAFSGISPLLSYARNQTGLEEELKHQALLAFSRFEEVWEFSDFWKRGNTFDACLVFAKAVQQRWPNDPRVKEMNEKIVKMLELNLAFFKSINLGVMWADDFGWWGLMALNARKLLVKLGEVELADKYWILADELCWQHKKNAAYDHTTNEGDIDMVKILRILKKNNFKGVLIPDHTPQMSCAAPWHAGMAYAMGYMKAAISVVEE